MKNVLAFILGMATTVVAIKLVTKAGDKYDGFEDIDDYFLGFDNEEDDFMAYNLPKKKPINIMEEKRKKDRKALLIEQDYLLASLADAISTQDTETIAKDKARLAEIHTELEEL